MSPKARKTRSFESSLKDLEKTVDLLEKGEAPLEEQLKAFEKGVLYSRECIQKLEEVEQRVEKVLAAEDGTLQNSPLQSR